MSDHPIVSRLETNLGWKAWLKPFFIHPSVTAGAKQNLNRVPYVKEQKEKRLLEAQIRQAAKDKNPSLFAAILKLIEGDTRLEDTFREIERSPFMPDEVKLPMAWSEVHKIERDQLRTKLREIFRSLQNPHYDALIDVAAMLEKADINLYNLFNSKQQLIKTTLRNRIEEAQEIIDYLPEGNDRTEVKNRLSKLAEDPKQQALANTKPVNKVLEPYVAPEHIFQGAFLKTYGMDGYDVSSTETTDAQGQDLSFDQREIKRSMNFPHIPLSLALWTFLGFPNRGHQGTANLSLRVIIRNLVGGWSSLNNGKSESWAWWFNPDNYTLAGKRLWNTLLLPVKLAVILPLKLIGVPLRFALNLVKLATELLPEVILNYSGWVLGDAAAALLLIHHENNPWLLKTIFEAIYAPLLIISAPIHLAARLLVFVGTALTSPEKSARSAWNYGRALNSRFGYLFGALGAALSITLTAVMWTLLLPLVISEVLILFPALAPVVASISHWPVVASALKLVNGTAVLVVGTLPAAFSVAATAISSILGVAVSATTLTVAATIAFIAAPVAVIASRIADELSTLWTRWGDHMPLLIGVENQTVIDAAYGSVKTSVKSTFAGLTPSRDTTRRAEDSLELLERAQSASQLADRQLKAEPYFAQTTRNPAPGIYCEPSREERRRIRDYEPSFE